MWGSSDISRLGNSGNWIDVTTRKICNLFVVVVVYLLSRLTQLLAPPIWDLTSAFAILVSSSSSFFFYFSLSPVFLRLCCCVGFILFDCFQFHTWIQNGFEANVVLLLESLSFATIRDHMGLTCCSFKAWSRRFVSHGFFWGRVCHTVKVT